MLGHVAPAQHRADRLADRCGVAQWLACPLHAGRDAREVVRGDGQQFRAFASPLFGQQRVLADHQAFTRIVGAGDLGHIAVIEQRGPNPAASPASGPSPRSGSIAHEQHTVVTPPIALPVRRRYPAGNSHTLPMAPSASTSAAKTQILQHAGTGPTASTQRLDLRR